MCTPKVDCKGVCLYRLFSTTLAFASRFKVMTRRETLPAESFCTLLIPVRSPASMASAIFISMPATEV